ncbi:MAG: protease complex subunit PrcB family protein [Candidatus Bipolaricaulaceae bacterium]
MVIGVFLGEKPTSGYAVEIGEVRLIPQALVVRATVVTPPPDAILLQVLTQPFHLVKVPRYDGVVQFELFPAQGKPRS